MKQKKLSFSEKKAQKFNNLLEGTLTDYFCVGMDKDGQRMFNIKLCINSTTPKRQRYDRYIGLLGQIQDIKQYVKIMWQQYEQQSMLEETHEVNQNDLFQGLEDGDSDDDELA